MFKYNVGWHLEITRRCPLACPACLRTIEFNSKVINPKQDININLLKEFFTINTLPSIKYICMQGNLGDPIYHPQFHDISEHFFAAQDLNVVTNGMHNLEFWERVLETWPKHSKVTLSIDGLRETNHIYRVNSNWDKIQELFDLISVKKRKCSIEWKYIVFEHNHHQVEQANEIAKKIGIDIFRIQKTRKLDPALAIKEYLNADWFKNLNVEYENELSPFCFTGDLHYIDAFGNYYPCCWWADTNKEENFWNTINIKNRSISDLKDYFNQFTQHLENYNTCPKVCKKYCSKIKDNNNLEIPNTQINRTIFNYDKTS